MKTIVITGVAGFIGSWTAQALSGRGDRIIGIDNFNNYYDPQIKRDRVKRFTGDVTVHEADISHIQSIKDVFAQYKVDVVCHLAAQAGVGYSLKNPFAYESANNLGTLNLLETCKDRNISSFIYASSSSVYGGNTKFPFSESDPVEKPISIYAASKRYNELLAYTYHHLYKIRSTGLRFFTAYGPWGRPDMALFKFTKAIIGKQTIDIFNHGKMKRDFTYITDIVAGVVSAIDHNYECELFNLGNSDPQELSHFIECIEKELGMTAQKNYLGLQPGDVPASFADITKARNQLGFSPKVNVEQGIREFVRWYKEYFAEKN